MVIYWYHIFIEKKFKYKSEHTPTVIKRTIVSNSHYRRVMSSSPSSSLSCKFPNHCASFNQQLNPWRTSSIVEYEQQEVITKNFCIWSTVNHLHKLLDSQSLSWKITPFSITIHFCSMRVSYGLQCNHQNKTSLIDDGSATLSHMRHKMPPIV